METKINADQFQKSYFPQAGVLGNISDMHIYFLQLGTFFPLSSYLLEHRWARQGWAKGRNIFPGCD